MRPTVWVRRQRSLKPNTYTARQYVNATGISVKDVCLTLGGLREFFFSEESAEVIVGRDYCRRTEPKVRMHEFMDRVIRTNSRSDV